MIKPDASLSIRKIPIEQLQVKEYQQRFPERVMHYVQRMQEEPESYAGLLSVVPSDTHSGMFAVLDGHHRYVASILTGKQDALCIVIEENNHVPTS